MGFLQRRQRGSERSALGLSSHYTLPSDLRRLRDREVGLSLVRRQVTETDLLSIGQAGQVAIAVQRGVTRAAELAASDVPHERARTDALADITAVLLGQKLGELGGAQS